MTIASNTDYIIMGPHHCQSLLDRMATEAEVSAQLYLQFRGEGTRDKEPPTEKEYKNETTQIEIDTENAAVLKKGGKKQKSGINRIEESRKPDEPLMSIVTIECNTKECMICDMAEKQALPTSLVSGKVKSNTDKSQKETPIDIFELKSWMVSRELIQQSQIEIKHSVTKCVGIQIHPSRLTIIGQSPNARWR